VCDLPHYTAACLQAVRRATEGTYEVLVVDNGSGEETRTYLQNCPGVRVLRAETNLGFAAACNWGAREARGRLLAFLNNDTVPLPGWLVGLRTTLAENRTAGIVGAKLLFPQGVIQHAGVWFHTNTAPYHRWVGYSSQHPAVRQTRPVPAVTGACILLRRADFLAVGGFDERYRNSFEDIDLCLKLTQAGLTAFYCAQSVLFHHTSTTPGRFDHDVENFSRFYQRWGSANSEEALPSYW
jgi:GT2 family glycosyltransferase